MSTIPFFSICIPAYKSVDHLDRLLHSIQGQTCRDFEVVVSDDSPDAQVEELIDRYRNRFPVRYQRNQPAAGTPANWNRAMQLAQGRWIKLMHDDDWFASPDALDRFKIAATHQQADFIFSGYQDVQLDTGSATLAHFRWFDRWMLARNPLYLFRKNYIGHPSTTLFRSSLHVQFDEQVKWVVDIECYIRLLSSGVPYFHINEPLIHLGLGAHQVTAGAFRNPAVEWPEALYFLEKLGESSLRNFFVHDHYWRLVRNLKISSLEQLASYVPDQAIPTAIRSMIRFQRFWGQSWMRSVGIYSKLVMSIHYTFYLLGIVPLIKHKPV